MFVVDVPGVFRFETGVNVGGGSGSELRWESGMWTLG